MVTIYNIMGLGTRITWHISNQDYYIPIAAESWRLKGFVGVFSIRRKHFRDTGSCTMTALIRQHRPFFSNRFGRCIDCPHGGYYTVLQKQIHIFEMVERREITWEDAKRFCEQRWLGQLLTVYNRNDMDIVVDVLKQTELYEMQSVVYAAFTQNKVKCMDDSLHYTIVEI